MDISLKIQCLSGSKTIFWSVATTIHLNAFVAPGWLLMGSFRCSSSVCAKGSVNYDLKIQSVFVLYLSVPQTSSSPLQETLQQLIVMPLPNILCVAKDPISGNTHSHTSLTLLLVKLYIFPPPPCLCFNWNVLYTNLTIVSSYSFRSQELILFKVSKACPELCKIICVCFFFHLDSAAMILIVGVLETLNYCCRNWG